jgi:mannose-6-phosphate isomerase-like protein (cupin superfamily)
MKFVPKRWGYELWIENNRDYCGKHLRVVPDHWCSFHYHKNKKETFYVIGGELLLIHAKYSEDLAKKVKESNNPRWDWQKSFPEKSDLYYSFKTTILSKGDRLTIEPYVLHSFTTNTSEPCDFVEISTFHEDSDSHRVYEG